jgi:hypothetical protein
VFERRPFLPCPRCRRPTFGVLAAGGETLTRRCKVCRHSQVEPLPELDKRVIYLDQFAFSELFKLEAGIRRPDQPHHDFWSELHRLVRRTLLLQQALFPASDIHSAETLVARHHRELRDAIERLGGDAKLEDTRAVESRQVWECFAAYQEGREPTFNLSVDEVLRRDRNAWLPDIRVVANMDYSVFAAGFRAEVDRTADEMSGLIEHWRATKPSFDEALRQELQPYGSARRRALGRAFELYEQGLRSPDSADMMKGAAHPVMREFAELCRAFERRGLPEDDAFREALQFWDWPGNQKQPYHRVSAYLLAGLSRKVVAGQRKLPTRGFMNDVRAIAAYGPYVDAMFLDKECAALLSEEPLQSELNLQAKVFSLNEGDHFLAYLSDIESRAGDEVRDYAATIYGCS